MFFVVLVGGIYTNAQFVHGGQKTTSSVSPPAFLPFVLDRVSPGPVTLAIQTGPADPSTSRDSAESTPSQSTGLLVCATILGFLRGFWESQLGSLFL